MKRSIYRRMSWSAAIVAALLFNVHLSVARAAPPNDDEEHLQSVEFLVKFYHGRQAWPKEKAASQLVRHGAVVVPVALKLIGDPEVAEPKAADDVHHGLLMLQHLYVDPNPSVRDAAERALQTLKSKGENNTTRRVEAILALKPVANAKHNYPRGLPAGLGQPGIKFTGEYFGYEKNNDHTFYQATLSTEDGVVKIHFETKGPRFGDPSQAIDIEAKLHKGMDTYVKVNASLPTGNDFEGGIVEKRISATAQDLAELEEKHPETFRAYQRVLDDLAKGIYTDPVDFLTLP